MSRTVRWSLMMAGLLALVAMVAPVMSQEDRPVERRPAMALGMAGGGASQSLASLWVRLLRLEQVQQELALVRDQQERLQQIDEVYAAKARREAAAWQGINDLGEPERSAKLAERRKRAEARAEELKRAIETVLLPKQTKRLAEIALQVRGLRALEDQDVQEALGMKPEQVEKLKAIRQRATQKARELLSQPGDADSRAMGEKYRALEKATQAAILAVLTPEQNEQFEKLQGRKVDLDFSQLMRRGAGRPEGKEKRE